MQWRENARYYSRLHDNFQIVASGTNWKLLLTSFQIWNRASKRVVALHSVAWNYRHALLSSHVRKWHKSSRISFDLSCKEQLLVKQSHSNTFAKHFCGWKQLVLVIQKH